MLELRLNEADIDAIDAIAREVSGRCETVESLEFQKESRLYADELPRRIRAAVNDYRLTEAHGALLISGLPVDDAGIGPTPAHWAEKPVPSPTLRHDIAFFLISCLLGEPIAWATQQDGYTMHDVLPIKGHEKEQIGSGSEELLTWHTEDAYHPLRTDYLGLMCLRNPDAVETTMADIADVKVGDAAREVLSGKRFPVIPDHSHRSGNQGEDGDEDPRVAELRARSYAQVERALSEPEPVAVLFGAPDSPYLRLDPAFMPELPAGEEKTAFDEICAAIDAAITGVVLAPGDIVFVDNYRMVHGRKPFRARFDGSDRWLRRLNITRDLRRSRANRVSAESRVIY
ncbi:guanitoxin biosynthesis L-enduracididine beta-hydroxylase GntD [Amycolatopsis sp. RTGN1]|uniref:guanitoxin biosynthesis L-enduracididine beta-hydroxylase GntD n=1 Tax=Amycolatopsis ponsaeliensis TaxID=2992142 RepID=UPI002549CC67|nr:guanitoxin biosynthesis L-enduracididine beta-hydroxylase GntD [Amycolatopsis sp. RTGN1]